MTCREAERLVMPYIHGQLADQELEIYFMVDVGLKQLDADVGTFNIRAQLEEALEQSRQRIYGIWLLQTARYAVGTLCFWSILVILVMQMHIWSQTGFLGL